jgi:RHS repeat-associated protein
MSGIPKSNVGESVSSYYAYSPYGETTVLGPDEGNPLQYTGRENDGTGLYYYRARYYDPVLKRFVSEDPIGIDGGVNTYTYVNGNPITLTAPMGLAGTCQDCRKIVDIATEYSGNCPQPCVRIPGYIRIWNCWPPVDIRKPLCICSTSTGPRG